MHKSFYTCDNMNQEPVVWILKVRTRDLTKSSYMYVVCESIN